MCPGLIYDISSGKYFQCDILSEYIVGQCKLYIENYFEER